MFFQTFISNNIQSNTPLWSLSVEAFCYILVSFFIRENNKKIVIYFAGFSCLLYILSLIYIIYFYPIPRFVFIVTCATDCPLLYLLGYGF